MIDALMFAHQAVPADARPASRSCAPPSASRSARSPPPVKDEAIAARVKALGRRADQAGDARSRTSRSATTATRRSRRRSSRRSPPSSATPTASRARRRSTAAFDELQRTSCASMVVDEGKRIDGREHRRHPRRSRCEVGLLPRAHGSALFTARRDAGARHRPRSAPRSDEQSIDALARRRRQALHAALQLPAVLDGRDQADARPRPPRDRPRRPRRARARAR